MFALAAFATKSALTFYIVPEILMISMGLFLFQFQLKRQEDLYKLISKLILAIVISAFFNSYVFKQVIPDHVVGLYYIYTESDS